MSEQLRQEFNHWVEDGRAAGLESHHRSFLEQAMQRMVVQPEDRVLEIGCGDGWALRMLSPLVQQGILVGLDVSDEMIRAARAKSAAQDNMLFVWSTAEQIPWQEDFFSKAFAIESFFYIENPERALRELHRVLEPGGGLWIVNHLSMENELSLQWLPSLKVPVQMLRAVEYIALLQRCGFVDCAHTMIPGALPATAEGAVPPFRDVAELRRAYEAGALLLTARKPA